MSDKRYEAWLLTAQKNIVTQIANSPTKNYNSRNCTLWTSMCGAIRLYNGKHLTLDQARQLVHSQAKQTFRDLSDKEFYRQWRRALDREARAQEYKPRGEHV